MPVSLYTVKKMLLAPRTIYRRGKYRYAEPQARSMLELHNYDRPMLDFMAATVANPGLLHDADLDESSVVLDVGAFDGGWSDEINRRYGSRIFAFEPNPGPYRKMADRFTGESNVAPFDFGLGGTSQVGTLALRGPGSSMYGEGDGFERTDVQIRDVVAVLDELHLEQIALMKVNIEGGEYDLFDRLVETGRLGCIDVISVQFHEWHPKAYRRRRQARRGFRRTHEEVWNYPWVWEFWRRSAR